MKHNLKTLLNLMTSTEEREGHMDYLKALIEELREEERVSHLIEEALEKRDIKVWAYNGGRLRMIKELLKVV